ncbi:microtubule associated protein-domain-containing protein [Morchella snyderi]|nr:microtubule associated protein-domain-containing protein [Morchella snyderi]
MDPSTNNSMQAELTKAIDNLHGLFDEIGLSNPARDAREASVYSALNMVLQKQLGLVAEEKEHLEEECRKLIVSIRQMEQSLDDRKSSPSECNDQPTTPLHQCLRGLKERHENVKKRHAGRYETIRKLSQALEQYASRLEPATLQVTLPPTTNDPAAIASLDLSHSYYEKLKEEFTRVYQEFSQRAKTVQSISREIINLYNELGIPKSQIDRNIVEFGTSQPERLGLLNDDLDHLRGKKDVLLAEKEKRGAQIEDLKIEIGELWEKLGVDPQEQKSFLAQRRGYDLKTIRELEKELDRLVELKQENLHNWVNDARKTLSDLWEKLYFSEEEISYFLPTTSDDMSDALLAAHELEIQRLQDLYSERLPIITLIDKHRSLIEDREILATTANDASRLISRGNGGTRDPSRLLREEKMRKRTAKDLPRVESELKKELEKWEDEYGEPFTVKGESYLETLMSSSVAHPPRSGARTPGPTSARPRSNTAGATPRPLSRVANSVKTATTPIARPKTPSALPLRSKTPTADRTNLSHGYSASMSATVGRPGGRALATASSKESIVHRSGAKTPGPGNRIGLTNSNSASNLNGISRSSSKSSTRDNRLPEGSHNIKEGTQTVGRFSTIKRKTAPLSNITTPKMQSLFSQPSKTLQRARAGSEISIRSVSPEEGDSRQGVRQKQLHIQPSNQNNGYSSHSRDMSGSSIDSMARKLSLTSSTTLTSGSGSENWETFGADSEFGDPDEERVDPVERYYKNKGEGYSEEARNGKGGGIVSVRSAEEWDDGCF